MSLTCKYCGRIDPKPIVERIDENNTRIICRQCYSLFNTCAACKNGTCAFESYTGPQPPWIMQTIQRGNMVAQHQIPNPEVVKVTCVAGCKCYEESDEGPLSCNRRLYNICHNYNEVE